MSNNEAIIRSGYAAAEGGVNDIKTFVSLFTPDGSDGKIQRFNCYAARTIMFAQLGVLSNLGAALTQSSQS